jgi:hypothetical protein
VAQPAKEIQVTQMSGFRRRSRGIGEATPGLLMWTALTFVLLFYFTGLAASDWSRQWSVSLLPGVPVQVAWGLAAVMCWLAALAAVYGVGAASGGVQRLYLTSAHRTGLVSLESFGAVLGGAALVYAAVWDAFYLPLALAAALPFWSAVSRPIFLRSVGTGRSVFIPPDAHAWDETAVLEAESDSALPEGFVYRRFEWRFGVGLSDEDTYWMDLPIDERLYLQMQAGNPGLDRSSKNPYYKLVVRGITQEVVRAARELLQISGRGLGSYDEICNAAAFVQQAIRYGTDTETKGAEYFRYPIETLYEQVGDCDCKAILLAAILTTMGHDVVLLQTKTHVALGVGGAAGLPGTFARVNGKPYFYLETTAPRWRPGELPADMTDEDFIAYPLGLVD